jgi:hypothetical protein
MQQRYILIKFAKPSSALFGLRSSRLFDDALSIKLYSYVAWNDLLNNDCGAVSGRRICKKTEINEENPPNCHFFHRKSHATCPEIESGLLLWETGGYIMYF